MSGNMENIGNDVILSPNILIKRPHLLKIGNHVAIDWGFYATTGLKLGDYIHIGPYVTVIGGETVELRMGNFTTIAAGCRLICASDSHLGKGLVSPVIPEKYRDEIHYGDIVMEDFSSLGTNTVVMPGVTLAEGSVVGANSFVNKNTQPWVIYVGSPAKPMRDRYSLKMIEYAKELGYEHK